MTDRPMPCGECHRKAMGYGGTSKSRVVDGVRHWWPMPPGRRDKPKSPPPTDPFCGFADDDYEEGS